MPAFSAAFDRQLEAFNSLDLDSFVSAYDPAATIARDETLFLSGQDEIRAFYQDRFRDHSLHCDVLERVEFGERWLVAHEKVVSSASEVDVIAVFEFENDLITRAKMMTASG